MTGPSLAAMLDDAARSRRSWVSLGKVDGAAHDRVGELLDGPWGIGAVVPMVSDRTGRVVEAGAQWVHGRLVARLPASLGPGGPGTAADVDGTTYPWVAVRRSLLAGTTVDHRAPPAEAVRIFTGLARRAGLRVVYDPAWQVVGGEPPATHTDPSPTETVVVPSRSKVLVVGAFVPASTLRGEDRSIDALLCDLASLPGVEVTFAAVDGFLSSPGADRLRAAGIEVITGPLDWPGWLATRAGSFGHVVVCKAAMASPVEQWLDATQPQAVRLLHLDSVPARDLDARRPVCPPDEVDGLDHVVGRLEGRLASWARRSPVVLCSSAVDAELVRGLVPGRAVAVLTPPLPSIAPGSSVAGDRDGLVILAPDCHDVVAGNEGAALRALDLVVRPMRSLGHATKVTVVSDNPAPVLVAAAEELGAGISALDGAAAVLGSARVALVLHDHGTGGPSQVLAAMAAGTPMVVSPVAVAGLQLDAGWRATSVMGQPADVRRTVRLLLLDDALWDEAARATQRCAAIHRQPAQRRDQLASLLRSTGGGSTGAGAGVGEGQRWPPPPPLPTGTRRTAVPPPLLRPLGPGLGYTPEMQEARVPPHEIDVDERYRRWSARYGPTPELLAALGEVVDGLDHTPTFSVVMPVYETDPTLLRAAVDSVRSQVYPHWELCIADDGSLRPDTLAELDAIAADPRVEVVHLAGNHGIAGATNAALERATGEYVAFMDHDDVLKPHALAQVARWLDADPALDVVYSDEDKIDGAGDLVQAHLKPDWSPDLLLSVNYMSHLTVARRTLVEEVGGLRAGFDGSQDFDLLLRLVERTEAVAHIPEPLYSWRIVPGSTAATSDAKPYAAAAGRRAVADALERRGTPGWVEDGSFPTSYRTHYKLPGSPRVSIVIPTRNGLELLRTCIESVFERSTYPNFEVVVVDNHSDDGATLEWLAHAEVRVIRYPHPFNYARQVNLAASSLETDALLFLNNDTEVLTPGWIEALLEHAMRPEVGAVGGRLYYPDGRIQHEGILVGVGGWALNVDHRDYFARGTLVRNASAVTGACTMVRPTVYARVGGYDEALRIAYNDVDFGLRIRQAGLQVVYTPYAELVHHEGATRGRWEHDEDGPVFGRRWTPRELVDPYYSPLFERDHPFVIAI